MSPTAEKTSASNPLEREVVITRVFNAPRRLVYEAWTNPTHMMHWWGPAGWTNPACELDVRPGGAWRIVMRAPDGGEYPCGGVYREIVEPERLVFTNIAMDNTGKHLLEGLTTVTFVEQGNKTKLILQTRAVGLVDYAARMLDGMEAGWTQSLERLAAFVASGTVGREIVACRVFDAPRELVFDAFTQPEHITRWWGPHGFTTTTQEMDFRPGGVWHHVMHGPDGTDYDNRIVYTQIVRPELIAFDHVSHPRHHTTFSFEDQNGKTRLTLHMLFGSVEEREWVAKVHGAVEGAAQTLERLSMHLASRISSGR